MATKLGRMVTYLDGLLSIKSHNFRSHGLVRSRDKLKSFYLNTTVPMATKLGRPVIYLDGILTIMSHDSFIT